MTYYRDKIVYITGGSSGIGLATARLLLRRGAHVVLFARNSERLQAALTELEAIDPTRTTAAFVLDVAVEDQVIRVAARAVNEIGPPHILINNAGIAYPDYFENIGADHFKQTLEINLFGPRHTCYALLPHMKRGGRIVNVSSFAGLIGVFGYTAYSASKFGLIGFSEALRCELAPRGIGVSVLCPPDTDTPQLKEEEKTKPREAKAVTSKASLATPEHVAKCLVNGLRKGRFLILPGLEPKLILLANRIWPGLVRWFIDRDIRNC